MIHAVIDHNNCYTMIITEAEKSRFFCNCEYMHICNSQLKVSVTASNLLAHVACVAKPWRFMYLQLWLELAINYLPWSTIPAEFTFFVRMTLLGLGWAIYSLRSLSLRIIPLWQSHIIILHNTIIAQLTIKDKVLLK